MGVPMGAPYFQWADALKAKDAVVCSSNFPLYADISNRVMQTLSHFNPELEIYSIDEAFLSLEGIKDPEAHCRLIRKKVLQWTGIPVSIGIAKTKTLAKVANRAAKKNLIFKGVYFPKDEELISILETLEVGEIWGIGRRISSFLASKGIHTAGQLCAKPDPWLKKNLSVTGLRTVWELQGTSCLDVEEIQPAKQSIMTSRSFGRPVFEEKELLEAICTHGARGAEKLREEGSLASSIQVFIMTSFGAEERYSNYATLTLDEPTDYTPALLNYAAKGLKQIFKPGFAYKKAGVLLGGLCSQNSYQQDLFVKQDLKENARRKAAMTLLDQANHAFGYKILQFASEGIERSWKMKQDLRSPCFTTRWSELLTIKI